MEDYPRSLRKFDQHFGTIRIAGGACGNYTGRRRSGGLSGITTHRCMAASSLAYGALHVAARAQSLKGVGG